MMMEALEKPDVLYLDPEATGQLVEIQEEAQRILQEANVSFKVEYVRPDPSEESAIMLLSSSIGGIISGLDMIKLYAQGNTAESA